jgi:hypothetical protein
MKTLRRLLYRLISWATSARDEELLRDEFEEHIALQTADNLRAGLSPIEARRQALLKFGSIEAMKDTYRDQRGLHSSKHSLEIHAMRYGAFEGHPRSRPPSS